MSSKKIKKNSIGKQGLYHPNSPSVSDWAILLARLVYSMVFLGLVKLFLMGGFLSQSMQTFRRQLASVAVRQGAQKLDEGVVRDALQQHLWQGLYVTPIFKKKRNI